MEKTTNHMVQKILVVTLVVFLVAGMAASCTLGAIAVSRIAAQGEQITQINQRFTTLGLYGDEHVTQEDDVLVAGEYMILSTLPVSDAYRSGDTSALDETQKETLEMASAVLDEIIEDGMTPYEKEKAVYDWMCANLDHEGGVTVAIPTARDSSSQPNGVLKYKTAVCVGFATTFRLFMQMLDIECMVVHNAYHSWNLVRLDGEWYHTDIYSDVGSESYANFNMTDDMCAYDHAWDMEFFPAATGLTYCYAYQNSERLDDVYQLPQLVRDAVDREETTILYLLIEKANYNRYQPALEALLLHLNSAVEEYNTQMGTELDLGYDMQSVEGDYLLCLSIYNYAEDASQSEMLSDEDQKRVEEVMEKVFGDVYTGQIQPDDSPITEEKVTWGEEIIW